MPNRAENRFSPGEMLFVVATGYLMFNFCGDIAIQIIYGASQASAEGVAEAPPLVLTPSLAVILPIAFYFVVWILHLVSTSLKRSTTHIERAAVGTFLFHLIWLLVLAFTLMIDKGTTVNPPLAKIVMTSLNAWLAAILTAVFLFQWASLANWAKPRPEHGANA